MSPRALLPFAALALLPLATACAQQPFAAPREEPAVVQPAAPAALPAAPHAPAQPRPPLARQQAAAPLPQEPAQPVITPLARAGTPAPAERLVTMNFRDAPLQEVFEMLSRNERVNVLLGKNVSGSVSVNLYDVTVAEAVHAIADAAGYIAERRGPGFVILERKEAGMDAVNPNTRVRTMKVQYSNPKTVSEILTKYLSRYGKITTLNERSLIVVEDLPDFVERIERILAEIDVQPQQILIEAKILEITLDDSETFGINWNRVFTSGSTAGTIGTASIAAPVTGPRFFFSLVNTNLEVFLAALSSKGRVRTLSTPKLLALENQEASTIIGDQTGYRVTTTINQVTTESIQFLESGVILRVTPSVDEQGRILMKIHPEVSTANITDGIPSKKSTEVTTQLLAEDGQAVFIGGLIKATAEQRRTGVPILGDIPLLGNLFVRSENKVGPNAETVVLITPHIVRQDEINRTEQARVEAMEALLLRRGEKLDQRLERTGPGLTPAAPAAPAR